MDMPQSSGQASSKSTPLREIKRSDKDSLDQHLNQQIREHNILIREISDLSKNDINFNQNISGWMIKFNNTANDGFKSEDSEYKSECINTCKIYNNSLKINKDLFREKVRTDKFLEDLSKLPNAREHVEKWQKKLSDLLEVCHTDDLSIKRKRLKKYQHDLDCYVKLDLDLREKKVKADQLLAEFSNISKYREHVEQWQNKFNELANEVYRADDLSNQRGCLEKYKNYFDCLELNLYLREEKALADQILKNLSKISEDHAKYSEKLKGEFNKKEEEVFEANNIEDKKERLNKFEDNVGCLELEVKLYQQKVKADQLLVEFSKISKYREHVEQWQNKFNGLANEVYRADDPSIKRGRLEEYKNYFDCLEINLDLREKRVIADQLLKELSKISKDHEEYSKQLKGEFDRKEKKVFESNNIEDKKERLNKFMNNVDRLELEVSLYQQKVRAAQLREKSSRLPESSEKLKALISKIDRMEANPLQNSSETDKKRRYVTNYTYLVDELQKGLEHIPHHHTRDITSTSGDRKEKEVVVQESFHGETSLREEHSMEKLSISDSKSNKELSEIVLRNIDLRIEFPTMVDNMKDIATDINNTLFGMREALMKAEHISFEHKLSILGQFQHRRGQIRQSWNEATKAYESGVKGKGILGRRGEGSNQAEHIGQLRCQLEDLKFMRAYLDTGESPFGSSTLGKEEGKNADNYLINGESRLYGVFDGVGNKKGSDLASKSVVAFIEKEYKRAPKGLDLENEMDLVKNVLIGANTGLRRQRERRIGYENMGTTASLAKIMSDGTLVIANVGDCRALLLKRGSEDIEHLTLDNSHVNEGLLYANHQSNDLLHIQKILAQSKNFEEFKSIKFLNNMITGRHELGEALGYSDAINPDIYNYKIERGDILILASDGTTDNLTDQEIVKEIKENAWNPKRAAEAVTKKAHEMSLKTEEKRSKKDDITTLVIMY